MRDIHFLDREALEGAETYLDGPQGGDANMIFGHGDLVVERLRDRLEAALEREANLRVELESIRRRACQISSEMR